MITIVQSPSNYPLSEDEYAFYYNEGSNTLITRVFGGHGICVSPFTLVIGNSEQECQDYIDSNNIIDPWKWTGE